MQYFGLKWTSNNSFFSSSLSDTSDEVIYKGRAKFKPKVMLWIAISENGLSKPYFSSSKPAVDQTVYQNEQVYQMTRIWPDIRISTKKFSITVYKKGDLSRKSGFQDLVLLGSGNPENECIKKHLLPFINKYHGDG